MLFIKLQYILNSINGTETTRYKTIGSATVKHFQLFVKNNFEEGFFKSQFSRKNEIYQKGLSLAKRSYMGGLNTSFFIGEMEDELFLDIDWSRDVAPGEYVVMECYRYLNPDTINLTGTATLNTASKTVIGANTIFDQEIIENDVVHFGTEGYQVKEIKSPTEIVLIDYPAFSNTGIAMSVVGLSDVWNDRWLKAYATAKIKYNWGSNLKKFGNVPMPGGVTLNGKEIYNEAVEEIDRLEEEIRNLNLLPLSLVMG